MKPRYIVTTGTTAVVVPLDTNVDVFNVNIRLAAGQTVQGALEAPGDSVASNGFDLPVTALTPQWQTLPAAVNGVISLVTPYAALLITPTTGGTATVLQQGVGV